MKSKKGFSLSTEAVVVLIILLIALIVVIILFSGITNPAINTIKDTANATNALAIPIGKQNI